MTMTPAKPETALAPRNGATATNVAPVRVTTDGISLIDLAGHLAKSGYFKDATDASKAVVKVLYGAELGIPPVSAMMGIHIIEGKPAPSANLLGAIVKRSGTYDYRVIKRDDGECELLFLERGQEVGRSRWTREDAVRAKLWTRDTWQRYPRQMLFSRALSEGVRTYFPDLFGGAPVYTPEELGADVDGETGDPIGLPDGRQVNRGTGEVIDVTARVAATEQHASYPAATGLTATETATVPPAAKAPAPPAAPAEERCPSCHAPAGKPHSKACKATGPSEPAAQEPAPPAAAPEAPTGFPAGHEGTPAAPADLKALQRRYAQLAEKLGVPIRDKAAWLTFTRRNLGKELASLSAMTADDLLDSIAALEAAEVFHSRLFGLFKEMGGNPEDREEMHAAVAAALGYPVTTCAYPDLSPGEKRRAADQWQAWGSLTPQAPALDDPFQDE